VDHVAVAQDKALADADATSDNAIVNATAEDDVAGDRQTITLCAEGMGESALNADANENTGMRRTGRKRKLLRMLRQLRKVGYVCCILYILSNLLQLY
jgi:hypothetical protein